MRVRLLRHCRWSCSLAGAPPGVADCGPGEALLGNEAGDSKGGNPTSPFHGYMEWIDGYGRCLCLVLRHEGLRSLRLRIHAVTAVAWTGASRNCVLRHVFLVSWGRRT